MLYLETVDTSTLDLLKKLQSTELFSDLRLVGGTSLALQLGRRKSIDLDFFGTLNASSEEIIRVANEIGDTQIHYTSTNINTLSINGV